MPPGWSAKVSGRGAGPNWTLCRLGSTADGPSAGPAAAAAAATTLSISSPLLVDLCFFLLPSHPLLLPQAPFPPIPSFLVSSEILRDTQFSNQFDFIFVSVNALRFKNKQFDNAQVQTCEQIFQWHSEATGSLDHLMKGWSSQCYCVLVPSQFQLTALPLIGGNDRTVLAPSPSLTFL